MDVYRAKTAGFCMGVSLALHKLNSALERKGTDCAPARICTLGPIIHNPQVLAEYESRGVVCVKEASQLHPGDVAVIRAHGRHKASTIIAQVVAAGCGKKLDGQFSKERLHKVYAQLRRMFA